MSKREMTIVVAMLFLTSLLCLRKPAADSAKLQFLDKKQTQITLIVDNGKEKKTEVTQYYGRVNENANLVSGILDSYFKLKESLSKSGYLLPKIDFKSNVVILIASSNTQIVKTGLSFAEFDNSKLKGILTDDVMKGGAEKEGKIAFAIVVIPKWVIK